MGQREWCGAKCLTPSGSVDRARSTCRKVFGLIVAAGGGPPLMVALVVIARVRRPPVEYDWDPLIRVNFSGGVC